MSKLIFDAPGTINFADPFDESYQIHESTLTFFKQSASGPSIMGDNYLPFSSEGPDPESDLHKIGSFFSVAIGQGSHYNTGIFGPLPVIGSKYRAIAFSTIVKDNKTFDERMKGWNYIIACFFFHEDLIPLINRKRDEIEEVFENFFYEYQELKVIRDRNIQDLKRDILSVIHN